MIVKIKYYIFSHTSKKRMCDSNSSVGGYIAMFQLQKYNTSVKRELLAGITTFFTFAYILGYINPKILSDAGVPFDQAFTATIIATVVGRYVWRF